MPTITDKMVYARKYTQYKLQQYELFEWTHTFMNKKTCAGHCNYTQKEIALSTHFVNSDKTTIQDIKNTVLHEIAHALCPKQGHNQIWKQTCIDIGGDGERCCEAFAKPKYIYGCGNGCDTEYYRKRTTKKKYVCIKHNLPIKLVKQFK